MADKSSIDNQLNWCSKARADLDEFQLNIYSACNSYDTIIEQLKNSAVFSEFMSRVDTRHEAFKSEAKILNQQLNEQNIAYVDKQSNRLQQELASFQG